MGYEDHLPELDTRRVIDTRRKNPNPCVNPNYVLPFVPSQPIPGFHSPGAPTSMAMDSTPEEDPYDSDDEESPITENSGGTDDPYVESGIDLANAYLLSTIGHNASMDELQTEIRNSSPVTTSSHNPNSTTITITDEQGNEILTTSNMEDVKDTLEDLGADPSSLTPEGLTDEQMEELLEAAENITSAEQTQFSPDLGEIPLHDVEITPEFGIGVSVGIGTYTTLGVEQGGTLTMNVTQTNTGGPSGPPKRGSSAESESSSSTNYNADDFNWDPYSNSGSENGISINPKITVNTVLPFTTLPLTFTAQHLIPAIPIEREGDLKVSPDEQTEFTVETNFSF